MKSGLPLLALLIGAANSFAFGLSSPFHHSASHAKTFNKVVRSSNTSVEHDAEVERRDGLEKRGSFGGRATFFEVGLGACGRTSRDSDFMVALNQDQYGDLGAVSSFCFQWIEISYNGKSHSAQILDACPGCPYGGLDMSPALFNYFADPGLGVIQMSWTIGGGDSSPAPSPSPKYTPTSYYTPPPAPTTPKETPTSYWTPPVESSTTPAWTPTPTPSSSKSTPSSSSSSAISSSLNVTSTTTSNSTLSATHSLNSTSILPSSTAGTSVVNVRPGGNLDRLSQVVLGLAGLLGATAQDAKNSH